jgi:hypothetical protein
MNGNRQRLAWAILLANFFVCILSLIAVPVGANLIRQQSTRLLVVFAQTNQGTLAMVHPDGETSALLASDSARESGIPVELITNSADTGLLELFASDMSLVGRVQLYGNTNLDLESAETPRFDTSDAPQTISMQLNSGRVRLTIPESLSRPAEFLINTQQGAVAITEPGQYFIDVSNTGTQVSVSEGQAVISNGITELALAPDQRGVINIGEAPSGPFETARNILRNGGFGDSMAEWVVSTWNVELADQPTGNIRIESINDESVLRVDRVGIGHADASVRQIVDQDVSAYEALQLMISVRFLTQSLPVCGSLGTECPLTVRIDYDDENGQSQVWQQGIYATGQPSTDAPNFCSVCGYPLNLNEHWGANRMGEVVFYESDNLIERWGQEGIRPTTIKSISLIAAGHAFVYDIIDVALIAENSAAVTPGTVEETGELLPSPDARSYGAGIQ